MFFSPENIEQARAKIYQEKITAEKKQDQEVISVLDDHKELIRNRLACEEQSFCLPIRHENVEKSLICSWFAAHGLICDKTVFVNRERGYDTCCWTVSLNKTTWWNRFFNN